MIYKMTLKDSADEMTFDLLEVPIVDKDIEGAVDNVTLDGNQYTDYLWLKKQFIQKWTILCDDEYTRLRGFYTRQFENADVPSYRLYYGDDIIRNSTLSGEYIQFSVEGVADGTVSLTQIDGNTTQQTYTGKNLWGGFANDFSKSSSGITFVTKTNGTITNTAGTTSAIAYSAFTGEATSNGLTKTLNAGTYCISGAGGNIMLDVCNTSGNALATDTGSGATFTLSAQQTVFVRVRVASGKTLTAGTTKPLLESGSQPTAYEPYVGGVPAPNPQFPMPIETVTGRQTVGVRGKNLLPIASPTRTSTRAGVTITLAEDGLITLNGTATGNSWADLIYGIQNNTTMHTSCYLYYGQLNVVFSAKVVGGTKTTSAGGITVAYNDTETQATIPFSDMTQQKTTSATNGINRAYIYIANGSVFNNYSFYLQVEEGTSASQFEPYRGQEFEVNLNGANYFDASTTTSNVGLTWAGGITYAVTNAIASDFIAIVAGQTLKLNFNAQIMFYDSSKAYLGALQVGGTTIAKQQGQVADGCIVPNDASIAYTRLAFRPGDNNGLNMTTQDIGVYIGPIELAKIGDYQDRIYKEDGKWYIEKQVGKVVLDGTETIEPIGSNQCYRFVVTGAFVVSNVSVLSPIISDYYTSETPSAVYYGAVDYGVSLDTNASRVRIHNKDCANKTALATWLQSHNTTVYYALATPTTTEITNEALVEELEALQDEAISVGLHNIYTDTPNALPTLTFDLTEYLSKSTTIIPETAVRLTLTDGGVINACGCRKDVQLTMRETIE